MKKILLVASVILMGAVAKAQETRFGAKAGFSMSNLKTEFSNEDMEGVEVNSKGKATFYVAGLVEHKFNDKFAVQAELGYSPLGGKYNLLDKEDEDGMTISNKFTLGTIYAPLMAKYYFTEFMNVHIGASLQYIISAKNKTGENFGDDSFGFGDYIEDLVGEEQDIKKYVNPFSVNPFLGLEYNLENGMFFDARYYLGVMDISKKVNGEGYDSLKNSFLQVGVGFKFWGN